MPVPSAARWQVHVPGDRRAAALCGRPRKDAGAACWHIEALIGQSTVIVQQAVAFRHASNDVGRAVEDHRGRRAAVVALLPPLIKGIAAKGILGLTDGAMERENVASTLSDQILQSVLNVDAIRAPRGGVVLQDGIEIFQGDGG